MNILERAGQTTVKRGWKNLSHQRPPEGFSVFETAGHFGPSPGSRVITTGEHQKPASATSYHMAKAGFRARATVFRVFR
jgi:hypothetical protein